MAERAHLPVIALGGMTAERAEYLGWSALGGDRRAVLATDS